MALSFRISALPPEPFEALFALDELELARLGMRRRLAREKPGYPCRVSLEDAEVGESLLLLPYEHHAVDSPYRASGPVYVREDAVQARPAPDEVPAFFRHRLLSARAYSAKGMMRDAAVFQGTDLEATLEALFADPRVAYVHLHNAQPGCFMARVDRA
jgi:hypothetical protein